MMAGSLLEASTPNHPFEVTLQTLGPTIEIVRYFPQRERPLTIMSRIHTHE